jgi:2-dehydropantoate 2-reductase
VSGPEDRVCIVGAGAIGGLYAAHLARLGELEVWAYDTSAEHVQAINERGLRVAGRRELTAEVHARTRVSEIPPCALGIFAVKSTVTDIAAAVTAPIFASGAVCSLQNGIGNEEAIAAHVPRVIRGVCLPAGRVAAPGVIEWFAEGETWIGPFEPQPAAQDEVEHLGVMLARAGLPTHALADARGPQWTKLLFNASTNPVCALTGLTVGEMCNQPGARQLVTRLIDEGRAVATALGITLGRDPEEVVSEAVRINYLHRPSMLQDVDARRPTEITALNGALAQAARASGIEAPAHEAIAALITALEAGWRSHS